MQRCKARENEKIKYFLENILKFENSGIWISAFLGTEKTFLIQAYYLYKIESVIKTRIFNTSGFLLTKKKKACF